MEVGIADEWLALPSRPLDRLAIEIEPAYVYRVDFDRIGERRHLVEQTPHRAADWVERVRCDHEGAGVRLECKHVVERPEALRVARAVDDQQVLPADVAFDAGEHVMPRAAA